MQNAEVGVISKTYLSKGELMEVERIAAKYILTEKELSFIIAMARRSKAKPENKPLSNDVIIQNNGIHFSIISLTH